MVRSLATSNLLMESTYDGLGRRRERVIYSDGVGETNRYVYHHWLVIAVLDGGNNDGYIDKMGNRVLNP